VTHKQSLSDDDLERLRREAGALVNKLLRLQIGKGGSKSLDKTQIEHKPLLSAMLRVMTAPQRAQRAARECGHNLEVVGSSPLSSPIRE